MATCVTVNTDGTLVADPASTPNQCQAYVMLDSLDYQTMAQSVDITPAEVLYVFSWGFGVVLFFWSLGFAVGVAKSLIKQV